jgi:2-oxoglutarate/2-oxoacid ferredoxin oxidoreductase subunit alpha
MSHKTSPLHRYVVKIGGESGQGVNSVGEIVARSLKESGYYVFGYREYPSLIKGGFSCYQIDFSDQALSAPAELSDLLVCLSRVSVHKYLMSLRPGGVLLHTLPAMQFSTDEQAWIAKNKITIEFCPAEQIALQTGGRSIMLNTVMVGILLGVLGLEPTIASRVLEEEFAKKPDVLEVNKKCLQAGFEHKLETDQVEKPNFKKNPELGEAYLLTGNHAIALGAVAAGVRAYYAYPMTPSSSILSFLANWSAQTGMLVKQIEDEISVAQMGVGSMFMGTRALVGTSGGGFDLMTETVSLTGITETPFVCILGQRPGPATGLPTWTAAGDLNLAIYAGHGEYARLVLAASDLQSCYRLVQEAFNWAEKYQIAVIVMTEKMIAESQFMIEDLPEPIEVERHLVADEDLPKLQSHDRYKLTKSGVSPRWLPGQSPATFDANGDEHLEDGSLTEEAVPVKAMYDKRLRKLETLARELPEPEYTGPATPEVLLVGWGSVKNSVLDALAELDQSDSDLKIGYLHYEYMFPLKTERLLQRIKQAQRVILIEHNYFGQLGQLITQQTGYQFNERWLKYDGRSWFVEELVTKLKALGGNNE